MEFFTSSCFCLQSDWEQICGEHRQRNPAYSTLVWAPHIRHQDELGSHEWKDGLPLKALSNIEELEKQRDRLRKELQQRQLQIESMEQVNTKQKQKFDVERMAYSAMATDNKLLMETCEQLEKKRHRLEYDLQMKEAQLLQIEEGYTQKKKQLDEQSHKVRKSTFSQN
ncbi:hypothetical protein NP493_8102g00000 [Ridgeia piscesae]|uniref:Centromere protein Cenp-F N-terminal domain-containing protein n=1 Tax=Ridgeia piscesae TaxID=27915 RepID=A0AAD9IPB6_RIDPI|nr:hypothetical protein NP493_8102g00000 [Ridgeia piscesae]